MSDNVKTMKKQLKELLETLEKELNEYANFEIDAKLFRLQQQVMEASKGASITVFDENSESEEDEILNEIVEKLIEKMDAEYEISMKEMHQHLRALFVIMNDLATTLSEAIENLKLGVMKPRDFSEVLKAFSSVQSEFRKTVETFGGEEYVAKRNAIADAMREMIVVKGQALIETHRLKRKLEKTKEQVKAQQQLIKALINLTSFLLSKYKRLMEVEQRLLKARSEQARLMANLIKKDIGMMTEDEITVIEVPMEFSKILEDIAKERNAIEEVEDTVAMVEEMVNAERDSEDS